jgi:hypothetical protein
MLSLRPNSYAAAERWDDLVYVFTESLRNSFLDEMILLVRATIPSPHQRRFQYVRLVAYNRLDEVPKLVLPGAPTVLRSGAATFTPRQRPHVGAATGARPDGGHDGQGQQKHIDGTPQERMNDGKETEVVTTGGDHEEEIDETLVNAARVIQDAYRHHRERKRTPAARKIQAAYRRYLKRKRAARKGIDATQAQYWEILRKESTETEWSKDSQYYLLFRVPLAYILVCLDAIKSFAESGKKEAKKLLMTADHRGIEEQMGAIDQYGYDSVGLHIISRV